MNSITKIVMMITAVLSLTFSSCTAQLKNAKSETYHVYGNCETCKKNIEKAANKKGITSSSWNKDTKILSLSYDSTKTNADAVLKNIALAGYDNDKFIAPESAYNKLDRCCQYERPETKTSATQNINVSNEKVIYTCPMHPEVQSDKTGTCPKCGMALVKKVEATTTMQTVSKDTTANTVVTETVNPLADVYAAYFSLKDALTKDDGTTAAAVAKELSVAVTAVPMEKLSTGQHLVWMKLASKFSADANTIGSSTDIEKQRSTFNSLSNNMYEMMKVIKPDFTTYYDYCPMKNAYWLSKESGIKNPYYGSSMLTCGSTKETIITK